MKQSIFFVTLSVILCSSCKKADIPIVITVGVTEIKTTSAVSGGQISDNGGAQIITQGICWNTEPAPVIGNNKTTQTGSVSFTSNLTGLQPNNQYYVRAYATNEAGTGYGQTVTFKTSGDKPYSVSTDATNIMTKSATLNGNVNPNFLSTVITFEYGITTGYGNSISSAETLNADNTNLAVHADISGLLPGTIYHFRLKAENSLGITYSNKSECKQY